MSTPLSLPGNVPPGLLLAALHAGAGAGGGPQLPPLPAGLQDSGGPSPYPKDPLEAVQTCINDLHSALPHLPDAQDTQDMTQALLILSRIQSRLMAPKGAPGGAQQAR